MTDINTSDLSDAATDGIDGAYDAVQGAAKPAKAKAAEAAKAAGQIAKKVQAGFSSVADEGASLGKAAKAKLKAASDRAQEALEDAGDGALSTRDDAYAAGAEIVKAVYGVYVTANNYLRGKPKRSSAILFAVLAVGAYMLVRSNPSLKQRFDRLVQPGGAQFD